MSEVRLIDANALEKTAIPCEIHNGALTEMCVPLYQIRNAPTVDAYPFEQILELVKLNQQFAQEIENLKRPTGEWKFIDDDLGFLRCSLCGHGSSRSHNFCPNCGAKMIEEAENE